MCYGQHRKGSASVIDYNIPTKCCRKNITVTSTVHRGRSMIKIGHYE